MLTLTETWATAQKQEIWQRRRPLASSSSCLLNSADIITRFVLFCFQLLLFISKLISRPVPNPSLPEVYFNQTDVIFVLAGLICGVLIELCG